MISWFKKKTPVTAKPLLEKRLGIIAGSGSFPLIFARAAQRQGYSVVACSHTGETSREIDSIVELSEWIKVGQLGRIIDVFKSSNVTEVALAGGIDRIRLFGGVKLDTRGMKLLNRLRSTKDDVIMRGIAEELATEGITVIECTRFLEDHMAPLGVITERAPSPEEETDIAVGTEAIRAMSGQDIGQTVVVKEGLIVAVEAIEGTDRTIRRGGELAGAGTVVVKFSKTTQDLRFDVPTVGIKTVQSLVNVKANVLAVEATRCLMLDRDELVSVANHYGISVIGCSPLLRSNVGS